MPLVPVDVEPTFGAEKIGRAFMLALSASINPAIDFQTSLWGVGDKQYATALGREYVPIIVEKIDFDNMDYGSIPSFIDAPVDKYPSLTVFAFAVQPIPDLLDYDQRPVSDHNIIVSI